MYLSLCSAPQFDDFQRTESHDCRPSLLPESDTNVNCDRNFDKISRSESFNADFEVLPVVASRACEYYMIDPPSGSNLARKTFRISTVVERHDGGVTRVRCVDLRGGRQ